MKAMYIGSFDPFTLGHLDIVKRVLAAKTKDGNSPKYEHLVICIGKNPAKKGFLSYEKRKELIEGALKDCPQAASRVTIICREGLTVDIAQKQGVNVLIRGIRKGSDDEYKEMQLAETNLQLALIRGYELPTDFIVQDNLSLRFTSSSLVRSLLEYKEYIALASHLPRNVCQELLVNGLWKRFEDARNQRGEYLNPCTAWRAIKEAYMPRPYHNLVHVAYMLNMFDIYKRHSDDTDYRWRNAIEMAIFIHDFVYDVRNDRNEAASVEKLEEWKAKGWMKNVNVPEISKLIMATTHKDENLSGACAVIADLDLSILGTSNKVTWQSYNQAIREEYAAYSDEEFYPARAGFLSGLLQRKYIFHTEFFRKMLEQTARQNIAAELQRISNLS